MTRHAAVRLVCCAVPLLVGGCRAEKPPWPALPDNAQGAQALVEQFTVRAAPDGPAVDETSVLLRGRSMGLHTLPVGWPKVHAWVEEQLRSAVHGWLLVGSTHDAALHVQALHTLVGPEAPTAFTHLVVEQFHTLGRWQGVEGPQDGDTPALQRYASTGDKAAYAALAQSHGQHDYTAWKYGYAQDVLGLAVLARGTATQLLGCDAPDAVQQVFSRRQWPEPLVLRLRELHCFLHAREALSTAPAPHRTAVFFGWDHVGPQGIRRCLPPADATATLWLMGGHPSPLATTSTWRDQLILLEPVLVPLAQGEAALLLPDVFTGGHVDRARATTADASPMTATAMVSGNLVVDGAVFALDAQPRALDVRPGPRTFVFQPEAGPWVLGSMRMGPGGALRLDPGARTVSMLEPVPGK